MRLSDLLIKLLRSKPSRKYATAANPHLGVNKYKLGEDIELKPCVEDCGDILGI